MAETIERPRLRPGLAAARASDDPTTYMLWDNRRITQRMVRVRQHELAWAQLLDGRHSLDEVQQLVQGQFNGATSTLEDFTSLIQRLDTALLLDSPRLYEYLEGPVREPSCIGTYAAEPDALRSQLKRLFTAKGGPGLLSAAPPDSGGSLRAVLAPHSTLR